MKEILLKVSRTPRNILDMIFNEDAMLIQFFEIYDDNELLLNEVLKYCNSSQSYQAEDDEAQA